MIAEPRPRATAQACPPLACPACRSLVRRADRAWDCQGCGRRYDDLGDVPDLRIAPDRYLSLEADRRKAEGLAAIDEATDLAGLARAYYAMTEDVDDARAQRFAQHVARADGRGERLARLVHSGGHVLEIGCGSGGALAHLRGRSVVGVDIAMRWLMVARRRSPFASLVAANAEHLPWPDSTFAAVYADSLVEHLDEPVTALCEFRRVAKPNARLVVVGPNRWSLLTDPHAGLWGVGWLPRRWQAKYVRARRGCGWPIQLRSGREVAKLVAQAGWRVRTVRAAPFPTTDRQILAQAYDAARTAPGLALMLQRFGPLWLVEAEVAS